MKTLHRWFSSGSYSLLGHVDQSQEKRARLGVVIVPPFGWEDVCSYRPLRFMARTFAGRGIPTLRYDLPGTGDSSGDARDAGLFDAWIQSIDDAAAELRKSSGVENVAVVGIHLGAMLAMAAAARGANLQELVLWGASATGRAVLRELRAAANMERWECLRAEDAPPQPIPGFEVGGFLIAPETQRALEELDISTLSCSRCRRVLLLSRDGLAHDGKVAAAFEASDATVEVAAGHGYSAMTALPHDAVSPEDTSRLIAEFLLKGARDSGRPNAAKIPLGASVTSQEIGGTESFESIYTIETPSSEMFGILAEPAANVPRSEYSILYLNPGGVRHTGPNRMWVESARRWAARGIASLRLDLEGIGESDGEQTLDIPALHRYRLVEQIGVAIESLRLRTGARNFAVVGLCSGAYWAFHATLRNPDIRAAILLNPRLFFWDPDADQKRILRRTVQGFTSWADWSRLFRGGVQFRDVQRAARMIVERLRRAHSAAEDNFQMGPQTVAQGWAALENKRKRLTLIFREGEPLLTELEESGQLPSDTNTFVRCIRVVNGGHTFRPLWAQKMAHELIDGELERAICHRPPDFTEQPDEEASSAAEACVEAERAG